MYPALHGTTHGSPAFTLEHPLTSYPAPREDNAAHPATAVHVGSVPDGCRVASVFSLGQPNVDPLAPV